MPDESNEQFKEFQEIVSEDMDDFEERLDEIKTDISLLKNGSLDFDTNVRDLSETLAKHRHTGVDRTQKIRNIFPVTVVVPGTSAAIAGNYGTFWQNHTDRTYLVIAIKETHAVARADAGGATLQIERLQGTEAKDAGDDLLTTAFDLEGTANTNSDGSLIGTLANLTLESGDRLGLVTSTATLTSLEHVCVTVYLQQT